MDIIRRIEAVATSGTEIPKPEAKTRFWVKGWGRRRGERALIYLIPNNRGGRPYEEGVTESELIRAYEQLFRTGSFTKSLFNSELPGAAKEGGCNFTTIGGVFRLVGEARHATRGIYSKI
ncbi:hypothetical protein [Croceicoccus hydrothermalis]|uniref:hypothetical protein n=1 Tax=Croceicoccus hydrothermalis TaxID=2867964 RepID=UPI001EFB90EF|nr:hypothetical protein [Croceicoccus hydrothermalis]